MRTGSKIENPSTSVHGESRELQLLLFNFLCNLNRAPYKCSLEKWVALPGPPPYDYVPRPPGPPHPPGLVVSDLFLITIQTYIT